MSTTSREGQGMSTNGYAVVPLGLTAEMYDAGSATDEAIAELAIDLNAVYFAFLKAAPAGEVTADAVEVALGAIVRSTDEPVFYYLKQGYSVTKREVMQAALAAAYPALVQQVEAQKRVYAALAEAAQQYRANLINLRAEYAAARNEIATLSAENARLAKDAERIDALEQMRLDGCGLRMGGPFKYDGTRISIEVLAGETTREAIDAAVDAATSQAKQAEEQK